MRVIFSNNKLLISIALVIISIIYRNELKAYYDNFINGLNTKDKPGIYTKDKLAEYDGEKQKRLYLAVLGKVFDVTQGKTHYEKGAAYNYFIGKDGSRALVTGNFKDESDEKDHVIDLSCNDLFTLVHWRNTFKKKYIDVGILIGRFYDDNGRDTTYAKEFNNKLRQCEQEKESSRKEKEKYPPCNIAWSADEGTRVWCTTTSGGVKRTWAGVPRQLYTPGVENSRCACINVQDQDSPGLFKEYDNCPKSSTECLVKT